MTTAVTHGLLYWLEEALRSARESADKPRNHVLRFFPFDPKRKKGEGREGTSENALLRRENHQVTGWPNNPDLLVNTYTEALELSPLALWADALRRYARAEGVDLQALLEMLEGAEQSANVGHARSRRKRSGRAAAKRNRRGASEA